ncbi:hypothetical protein sce8948 [Sorangium cellulosum So ce56]|uniref:Bacteriophage T5 Orf172 DNA-binding domain-containing protein n=2 Tax=Polyangiaceae TaxID=49 RepID=A9G946_SORC5|nr:hypothetical protein sce8948 [Sorangium cellulosum So ce56]
MLQESRVAKTRKIRDLASGADFGQWLISNVGREDPVGDLAHDVVHDPDFPRDARHYPEALEYLQSQGYCLGAQNALAEAWNEYLARYPERAVKAAWCERCARAIVELPKGVLVWTESGGFEVLHTCCVQGVPRCSIDLHQLFDGPDLGGLNAFANECGAPSELVARLEARLRLWGFGARRRRQTKVYFIQEPKDGAIKIGYTSGPVERRRAALQTGHPEPLRVLATMDGDRSTEADLHARFGQYRRKGEWFAPHRELIQFIAALVPKVPRP